MHSLLISMFFFFSATMFPQTTIKELDQVYGLNQLLYNGEKYTYFLPAGTSGNQFLFSPDFISGGVTIKGETFQDIFLNYDIYNQQLLLQFTNENGGLTVFEVSKAWLEQFRLGKMNFGYLNLADGPRFYQVIGDGSVQILYYFHKKLDLETGSQNHEFTPLKESFILIENQINPFKNKRTFIAIFDEKYQVEIKNYLHKNKVRIKKASDQEMTEVINYIGNL